uniref:Uncharacterized protein n=1 Tax=Rhizophora mucronata TaxID=61149 RepID=A0A2P2NU96_RHIMU
MKYVAIWVISFWCRTHPWNETSILSRSRLD